MNQARFLSIGGLAVALLFLVGVPSRAAAEEHPRCQQRVEKAQDHYRHEVREHGRRSHQAEEAREHLRNAWDRCWSEEHGWYDPQAHEWRTDRDWDRNYDWDRDDRDRDHDHDNH